MKEMFWGLILPPPSYTASHVFLPLPDYRHFSHISLAHDKLLRGFFRRRRLLSKTHKKESFPWCVRFFISQDCEEENLWTLFVLLVASVVSMERTFPCDFFSRQERARHKNFPQKPEKRSEPRGWIYWFFLRSRIKCFIMILLSDLFVFPVSLSHKFSILSLLPTT